jgi:hypothetical protein
VSQQDWEGVQSASLGYGLTFGNNGNKTILLFQGYIYRSRDFLTTDLSMTNSKISFFGHSFFNIIKTFKTFSFWLYRDGYTQSPDGLTQTSEGQRKPLPP